LKNSNFYFAAAVFWFLFVTLLLCLPGSEFPKATWLSKIWIDKWVHIFLFFLLVIPWCLAFAGKNDPKRVRIIFIQVAVFCFLYGALLEVVQHFFIKFRSFELGDIAADGIGCLGGYFFSIRRFIKR
jgi:VanZ family protein